jgi:hypothetical protein
MQQVQVYISDERVEMFNFESITITDTIKDVRDVNKVFTEYSQTFSLPASKANNKIFKHYYNSDITNSFDSRIRVRAKIELNNILFRNGYIKLEGVNLKNNNPHTYRITFFGNTVSLKDLLGDDLISSLSWLDNFSYKDNGDALTYGNTDIETYLTSGVSRTVDSVTYVNPIQVPLITHSQRLYYDSTVDKAGDGNTHYNASAGGEFIHGVKWSNLKYAIKLNVIVRAIEKEYNTANGYSQNLTFSADFFNKLTDNEFSELYMWLHRVKGEVTNGGQIKTYSYTLDGFANADNDQSVMFNNSLRLKSFGQVSGPNEVLRVNLIAQSGYSSVPYSFEVLRDGLSVYSSGIITGDANNINIPATTGSNYKIQINTTVSMVFKDISWNYSYYDSETQSTVNENYFTQSAIAIPQTFDFNIAQQVPKMKVLDFLTSIFKMFNLVAYIEGETVVVEHLDDYYLAGNSYDITKYIDTSESRVDSVIPFREIIFGYDGLNTFLANRHNQLFNEDWGTEEYSTENSSIFTGGIYQYKIPFEHMKFERLLDVSSINPPTSIQWGYSVDDKQDSHIGKPLVFYMASQTADISFAYDVDADDNINLRKKIETYFAPANSNLILPNFLDRQSINFSPESDEWELTPNKKSLFNSYHSNYISGIFNKTNRLSKMTAFLPLRILLKYSLKDRFIAYGRSYKINSIETNMQNGKSQLELLSDYAPAVIDLVPPTAPSNLAVVQGSETVDGFSMDWTAGTDNVGITGYIIDIQQEFYRTIGNVTSYTFTGLDAGTTYVVAVYATDAAGNVSPISNIATATTDQ